MVYYRKYRPQTIDELDSSQLRETLNSVFFPSFTEDKKKKQFKLTGDIPHAFLFTGPKGLGKTSTARIVSKVINCVEIKINGKSVILCDNHCEPCKTIAQGSNLDVIEIDGASNRGIDEVRDLREKVRLSPVSNHKKIYIIDEVHMLTTEAFNALLKTIEEPPSHVVFIFCTTEAHKVPATIFSRCFNVPFTVATSDELERSFSRIVKGEHLQVDDEALHLISQLSDGSFRDGAKVLEELAMITNGTPITTRIVEEKYHITSIPHHVQSLLESFANHDTKSAIQLVSLLTEQGIDTKYFLQQVLNELHTMMLMNVGVYKGSSIKKQQLSLIDIQMLVQLLSKAYSETKYAAVEQLPMELAIIAFTSRAKPVQIMADKQPEVMTKTSMQIAHSQVRVEEQSSIHISAKSDNMLGLLIDRTKVINQSLAGILRGCTVDSYDGKTLVIAAKYKFHKERLDDALSRSTLEKITEEIAGNKVMVSVLLKE